MNKRTLVKTPINGIPIGEVYQDEKGVTQIRIKKAGSQIYEVISLEQLLSILLSTTP